MTSDRAEILLVEPNEEWAADFISELRERGWTARWHTDDSSVRQESLYQVYLINPSVSQAHPREICSYIRGIPKGENASIFLLNDGSSELRSFEDALSVQADGLYFHHAQLALLLTNFPAKAQLSAAMNASAESPPTLTRHTLSRSNHSSASALQDVSPIPEQPTLHNRQRVMGMSLGHRNRQRLSLGYSSEQGFSVSDIEAALAQEDPNQAQEESPKSKASEGTSLQQDALTPQESVEAPPESSVHHKTSSPSLVTTSSVTTSRSYEPEMTPHVSPYPSPEPSLIRDPAIYMQPSPPVTAPATSTHEASLTPDIKSDMHRIPPPPLPTFTPQRSPQSVNQESFPLSPAPQASPHAAVYHTPSSEYEHLPKYTPKPVQSHAHPVQSEPKPMSPIPSVYPSSATRASLSSSAAHLHGESQRLERGEDISAHEPLSGDFFDLKETPFARYFGELLRQRGSSVARIEELREPTPHSRWWEVSFFEGEIVGLSASHLDERLTQHLIAQGSLSQADAESILGSARARDPDGRLESLIDLAVELIPQMIEVLETAVEEVLTRSFLQLFELTTGWMIVSPFERPAEPIRLQRSSTRLLIDGIHGAYSRLRLYGQFTTLKAIPLVERVVNQVTLQERAFLERAHGDKTISELAEECGLTPVYALGLCYALSLMNVLDIIERSPLKDFYQRACTEDYFQLLGLQYDVDDMTVTEEWQRSRQWLSAQRGDPALIQGIVDILNDAYCVLAHAPLRTRYLSSLSKPIYSEMSIMPQPGEVVSFTHSS